MPVLGVVLVVIAAMAVGAMFVLIAGKDPVRAVAVLIGYTLGTGDGFAEVVVHAIPLSLAGLGIAIAFRANVFNIGADGQLIFGAIAAVAIVQPLGTLPAWLAIPLFLLVGTAFGAVYGGLAGWLKARYNANEIIVTIMLNYIALQLLGWAVRGPLQEGMKVFPRSESIGEGAILGVLIDGTRVHGGLIVVAVATACVYMLLRHSSFGYQLRAVGISHTAARYGGIAPGWMIFLAMTASGALAGLAGAVEIAGIHHRLQDNFAPGIGIAAIAVALLARLNPLWVPVAALLFGILHAGSGQLQREIGIPFPLVWIVEAIVILAFLAIGVIADRRK